MRRVAVSVATGRVSAVFFEDGDLIGWCRSAEAHTCIPKAKAITQRWVAGFGPDQMLTEDRSSMCRKGPQSQDVTEAIADTFAEADGLDLRVRRVQQYENKYDEAAALAKRYPAAQSILPSRPPLWLPEPRNMGYFEALSLIAAIDAAPTT